MATPMGFVPRIGLSACFFHAEDRPVFKFKTLLYLEQSMVHWVASAGAVPWMVPTLPSGGPLTAADIVDHLDGLLLHGGADVCPRSYGEEPLRPGTAPSSGPSACSGTRSSPTRPTPGCWIAVRS